MENYTGTERISQKNDGGEDCVRGLLDKASDAARATLESMQAPAGTTSCKGVQNASLEKHTEANSPCFLLFIRK